MIKKSFISYRFKKDEIETEGSSVENEAKAVQCENMGCLAQECAEAGTVVQWRTADRCRMYFSKLYHILL